MAKLTDATITEVSSLDDTALFYAVDTTRATGDQDTRITKANLKTQLTPTTPTLQQVATQGAEVVDTPLELKSDEAEVAIFYENQNVAGSIQTPSDGATYSSEDASGNMTQYKNQKIILNNNDLNLPRESGGVGLYAGVWNGSTNIPVLANTDANKKGVEYKVSTAGSVDFGAGSITFAIGDIVANDGSIWYKKVDNSQTFITNTYTFSTLPSGVIGMLATITDASSVSYRGTASGGGSDTALVFYDGTNWIYH